MKNTAVPTGSPAPRRRRSAEVARREILDAAQQRLSSGGPDALRLQDIANDVGIAHPTILHHFGSREGLIRALDARTVHALTDDVIAMLKSGTTPTPEADLIERVAETMDQRGLARLIAWWAMRDPGGDATLGIDPPELVQNISKLIAERLDELDGSKAESQEVVSFGVRLAVIAMFGDALVGDLMSPASPAEREAERHRFREWLAGLLLQGLATPEDDSSD